MTTPTLDDFPSDPEVPQDPKELDEFMTALHELDVDGVEVVDGAEHDAPHGSNTVEEMQAHELTPAEIDGLDLAAPADGKPREATR